MPNDTKKMPKSVGEICSPHEISENALHLRKGRGGGVQASHPGEACLVCATWCVDRSCPRDGAGALSWAPRGTKAAGLGLSRFLTIGGHSFQLSGYAYVLRGLKSVVHLRPQFKLSGSVFITKIILFSNLFSKPKKPEKRLARLSKNIIIRARNSLKTISVKMLFLLYVPCETIDLEVPSGEMSIQKSIKR